MKLIETKKTLTRMVADGRGPRNGEKQPGGRTADGMPWDAWRKVLWNPSWHPGGVYQEVEVIAGLEKQGLPPINTDDIDRNKEHLDANGCGIKNSLKKSRVDWDDFR